MWYYFFIIYITFPFHFPLLSFIFHFYHIDGGTLLKHPSAAMTKLIGSVDKGGNAMLPMSSTERALSRPVMAFIVQRHDLDGLQLAMRQALRKATCRVFALQVIVSSLTLDFYMSNIRFVLLCELLVFGTKLNLKIVSISSTSVYKYIVENCK